MDALVSYNVNHHDTLAIKTFITHRMLDKKFLAGNLFYPSIAHSDKDTEDFFTSLEEVIIELSQILLGEGKIKQHLRNPQCHSGFQRLN